METGQVGIGEASETLAKTESVSFSSSLPASVHVERLTETVDQMTLQVRQKIDSTLDEDLQKQLAVFVLLLPKLAEPLYAKYLPIAQVIASSLTAAEPRMTLAKELLDSLSRSIRKHPLREIVQGNNPVARVLLGLGTLLYFVLPFGVFRFAHHLGDTGQFLGLDKAQLLLVGLAGALGSIVSIMVRIRDFASATDTEPTVLFFTGFFKPIVGTAFALFVYVVLNAGILPITVQKDKAAYFFAALGFVSGFSERFASDVASQTERVISSSVTTTETRKRT